MKNYDRQITIICPICGNDQFMALDINDDINDIQDVPDEIQIQCSDCGTIFSKADLIEENQGIIDANIDEMKEEVATDFEKELNRKIKKIFK